MRIPQLRAPVALRAPQVLRTQVGQGAVGLLAIGALTGLMLILPEIIHSATAALLYLLCVLISAMMLGAVASFSAALFAALSFTYFFIPPYGGIGITSVEEAIRLIVFVSVALLVSGLASRARRETRAAAQRSTELSLLYQLSQQLEAEVAIEPILTIVVSQTARILDLPGCAVWLSNADGTLQQRAVYGAPPVPPAAEEAPLRAGSQSFGVLRVARRTPDAPLDTVEHELLQTIAAQVGLVLERLRIAAIDSQARALAESDRLKSTLLSLVSHDLRTPLAVIKGLVTSLLDTSVEWTDPLRRELLGTINGETDRLNRIVGDLLEMSRIEAGAISQARAWYDLDELIISTAEGLRSQVRPHTLLLDVPDDLPWVRISYAQIEQVLRNLLLNAAQYTPADSPIEVGARATDAAVRVEIRDRGPGVPMALRERIFEKFVRTAAAEQRAEGVGLGLAICKGLIEAHGGTIAVHERPGGGAVFAFTLPLATPESAERTAVPSPPSSILDFDS